MRLSGADVFWLAARSVAGHADELTIAAAKEQFRRMPEPSMSDLHLEGADLMDAHLEGALLYRAHLEVTNHMFSHLKGANLTQAHLEGAFFFAARLEGANLAGAHLEGARFARAHLEGATLVDAHLEGAVLMDGVHLEGVRLFRAHLEGARLTSSVFPGGIHLEGADLTEAHLEGKQFRQDDAALQRLRKWKPDFPAVLPPTDLRLAFLDRATLLTNAVFGDRHLGSVRVADTRWGEANLAVIEWSHVTMLGDERVARERKPMGRIRQASADAKSAKPSRSQHRQVSQQAAAARLRDFQDAARANRQLATALRAEGITGDADRFAYRAQLCQRVATRKQHHYLRYIGFLLLDLLAGYGYRPGRAILLYLGVIIWFANFYVWASHGMITLGLPPSQVQPLAWYEALILSVSSFHGRGFQPFQHLNDPVAALAGMQAVLGLVIEVSFIATFTQRFFGK